MTWPFGMSIVLGPVLLAAGPFVLIWQRHQRRRALQDLEISKEIWLRQKRRRIESRRLARADALRRLYQKTVNGRDE